MSGVFLILLISAVWSCLSNIKFTLGDSDRAQSCKSVCSVLANLSGGLSRRAGCLWYTGWSSLIHTVCKKKYKHYKSLLITLYYRRWGNTDRLFQYNGHQSMVVEENQKACITADRQSTCLHSSTNGTLTFRLLELRTPAQWLVFRLHLTWQATKLQSSSLWHVLFSSPLAIACNDCAKNEISISMALVTRLLVLLTCKNKNDHNLYICLLVKTLCWVIILSDKTNHSKVTLLHITKIDCSKLCVF